jgi:hypothetical protein
MSVELRQIGSVVVLVGRGSLAMGDANAAMALFGAAYASGAPYAVLIDGRGLSVPPADVRRRLSESPGKPDEIAADRGRHVAVVIDHAVLRGALTALQWFLPKVLTIHLAKTGADAAAHLQSVGHPRAAADGDALGSFARETDAAWLRGSTGADLRPGL